MCHLAGRGDLWIILVFSLSSMSLAGYTTSTSVLGGVLVNLHVILSKVVAVNALRASLWLIYSTQTFHNWKLSESQYLITLIVPNLPNISKNWLMFNSEERESTNRIFSSPFGMNFSTWTLEEPEEFPLSEPESSTRGPVRWMSGAASGGGSGGIGGIGLQRSSERVNASEAFISLVVAGSRKNSSGVGGSEMTSW